MNDLFRQEAVEHHGRRLYGEIMLATSLKSWVLTAVMAAILALAVLALVFGTFPRRETVSGQIVATAGLAKVLAPNGAIITTVHVREGQHVNRGDLLLTLQPQGRLQDGTNVSDLLLAELRAEAQALEARLGALDRKHDADQALMAERQREYTGQLAGLDRLIEIENERIRLAEDMIATAEPLLARGHITKLEMQERRQALLSSRSDLQRLLLQKEDTLAALKKLDHEAAGAQAMHDDMRQNLSAALSKVGQRTVEASAQAATSITAAISGTVTAVQANEGQQVDGSVSLLALVPDSSELLAELYVPTAAAGFLKEGQQAKLLMDAFPFQKFGAVEATIVSISDVAVAGAELKGFSHAVGNAFIVRAKPASTALTDTDGSPLRLRPGMALSADLILEDRAAWEAVFAPFLASLRR